MSSLPIVDVPDCVPLFAPLRAGLVSLLRSLTPDEWERPTVAGAWRVRDVAAHLLDGELRTLAAHRDGQQLAPGAVITDYADVMALIGRLNAEGVAMGRHLSTRLLVELLEISGRWMHDFLLTLDPDGEALFAVAWAGESVSTNRFDTAREYTERWHHEMQIRSTLGARGEPGVLLGEVLGAPLLETALQVVPHALRDEGRAPGTAIDIIVDAASWTRSYVVRTDGSAWRLHEGTSPDAAARLTGSADSWWRLFFNAMVPDEILGAFRAEGDARLLDAVRRARSVMV